MKKTHLVISDTFTASALFIELLSKRYIAKKLSLGEFVRDELNNKTELSIEMNSFFNKGLLLPVDIQIKILRKALNQCNTSVILDNYPRGGDSQIAFETLINSGEIEIENIWHLNLVNLEFAIQKQFNENDYLKEKYGTTDKDLLNRIDKRKEICSQSISHLSQQYKVIRIDVDFEKIQDLQEFYNEKINEA